MNKTHCLYIHSGNIVSVTVTIMLTGLWIFAAFAALSLVNHKVSYVSTNWASNQLHQIVLSSRSGSYLLDAGNKRGTDISVEMDNHLTVTCLRLPILARLESCDHPISTPTAYMVWSLFESRKAFSDRMLVCLRILISVGPASSRNNLDHQVRPEFASQDLSDYRIMKTDRQTEGTEGSIDRCEWR